MLLTKWNGEATRRRPLNILRRVIHPIVGFFIVVIAGGALPFSPRMTKRTFISINIINYDNTLEKLFNLFLKSKYTILSNWSNKYGYIKYQ
jgi:hypothetical protein